MSGRKFSCSACGRKFASVESTLLHKTRCKAVKAAHEAPSPGAVEVTCIASGPLTFALHGGISVRPVSAAERAIPVVAAFLADEELAQMVIAAPRAGVVRDYRKAPLAAVCGALAEEGKTFTVSAKESEVAA